jgi:hypothetical protein
LALNPSFYSRLLTFLFRGVGIAGIRYISARTAHIIWFYLERVSYGKRGGNVKWMEKLTGKNIIAKRVNKAGVLYRDIYPPPLPATGGEISADVVGGGGVIFENREENKGKM